MRGHALVKLTQFLIKNILLIVIEKNVVDALKYILECTFLDQSPQKLYVFALNLQYILI